MSQDQDQSTSDAADPTSPTEPGTPPAEIVVIDVGPATDPSGPAGGE